MKQDERLENALPDALFHASSLLKGSSMEKAISALAQGGYGVLSEKFAHAKRQVQSGGGVDEALLNLQSSSASVLFSRFCGLLLQAYHTGADMKAALRRAASDMMANFALVRERSAVLSMQTYTLFFGGAIVVPLILGSVLRMSVALSGGGFFEAGGGGMVRAGVGSAGGSGADGRVGEEVSAAMVPALHAYLALLALFTSALFALFEGRASQGILHLAISLPLSQGIFVLAYSIDLLGALA